MRALATLGPVGHLPVAPGTWGSAVAVVLALGLDWLVGPFGLLVALALAYGAGLAAIREMTEGDPDPDRPEIVIDEVVGQWVALMPVAFGALAAETTMLALWPGWVAAFVLFRLFDITKPGPIGAVDRKKTPQAVMLDDVYAGVAAGIGVLVLAALAHLVLM